MRNKWCLALGFVCLSLALLGCSTSPMSVNKVPPEVESTARSLTHVLSQQGYEVGRGYFRLYQQSDCQESYDVMKSCFGNNPAAPYILPTVTFWSDEYVDPATLNALGPTTNGYSSTFRFDPREAIVILAQLPPPAAYFGLQTYEFTHQGTYSTTSGPYLYLAPYGQSILDIFFAHVPQNPNRIEMLASLGNSINDVVIERQSGQAFDQIRYFIITPDELTNEAVRDALQTLQIDNNDIFTEPIPSTTESGIKIGLNKAADDFITVIRYAEPEDGGDAGTPSATWRNDLPMVVLRVRYNHTNPTPIPYGPVTLDNRTAWDETQLKPQLNELVSLTSAAWGQACSGPNCPIQAWNLQPSPVDLVGPDCTQIGMDCLADTQDTIYEFTPRLPLDEGEVYALVGPLSTETNNATYESVGVNNSKLTEGVGEVSDKLLSGTALEFASQVPDADKFFVYYFTRDCSGLKTYTNGNCFSVSTDMIPACTGDPTTCARLELSLRAYIRPDTERGPDAAKILPADVIPLKRP